jgi:hypothetical protein
MEALNAIREMKNNGKSASNIASELNKRGMLTARGRKWTAANVYLNMAKPVHQAKTTIADVIRAVNRCSDISQQTKSRVISQIMSELN